MCTVRSMKWVCFQHAAAPPFIRFRLRGEFFPHSNAFDVHKCVHALRKNTIRKKEARTMHRRPHHTCADNGAHVFGVPFNIIHTRTHNRMYVCVCNVYRHVHEKSDRRDTDPKDTEQCEAYANATILSGSRIGAGVRFAHALSIQNIADTQSHACVWWWKRACALVPHKRACTSATSAANERARARFNRARTAVAQHVEGEKGQRMQIISFRV